MRPRLNTTDDTTAPADMSATSSCFNEAMAQHHGRLLPRDGRWLSLGYPRFNEAVAQHHGRRNARVAAHERVLQASMRPRHFAADNLPERPDGRGGEWASMRPWLNTTDDIARIHERHAFARLASMRPWLNTTDDSLPLKRAYHNNLMRYLRGLPLNDLTARGEALPEVPGSKQLSHC